MSSPSKIRRRFIKAGLAVPLIGSLPLLVPGKESTALAGESSVIAGNTFLVPENIYQDLFMIYGGDANYIQTTDRMTIQAPDIAENGAVVGVNVKGEKGLVSSLAIFVDQNPKPLVSQFKLHEGADLAVGLRLKIGKTSGVYVIAETKNGLVGARNTVKVTIGCGGG